MCYNIAGAARAGVLFTCQAHTSPLATGWTVFQGGPSWRQSWIRRRHWRANDKTQKREMNAQHLKLETHNILSQRVKVVIDTRRDGALQDNDLVFRYCIYSSNMVWAFLKVKYFKGQPCFSPRIVGRGLCRWRRAARVVSTRGTRPFAAGNWEAHWRSQAWLFSTIPERQTKVHSLFMQLVKK